MLDREFALIDNAGSHFSLKRLPAMIRIATTPDLKKGALMISHFEKPTLEIPLSNHLPPLEKEEEEEEMVVCGDVIKGRSYSTGVGQWFQDALKLNEGVKLVRASAGSRTSDKLDDNNTPRMSHPSPTPLPHLLPPPSPPASPPSLSPLSLLIHSFSFTPSPPAHPLLF